MKKIFGRIYAAWFVVIFIVTLILVAIPTVICRLLIKDQYKRDEAILNAYRVWMKVLMTLAFCKVTIRGRKYFEKDQTYIVVFNHNALFDVLLSTTSVPGANKTLAKAELAKIPIFGLIYKSGSILVDRKDPNSRKKSVIAMGKVLDQGMHLLLYPEGTRNKSQLPIAPFRNGAFKIAIEKKIPVMPAVILHTRKVMPPGRKFYMEPHRVGVHFLPPVSASNLTMENLDEFRDQIQEEMTRYYVSNN